MKKVSVIIPCYCMQDVWIERLMNCLSNQTIGFEYIEVLFIVDASPDDTFERLQKWEQQYPENIMLINSNEKIGPGGARSLGIQYVSGEYVAFIDQDDWVEPCMYEHMYEKAIEYDCDVVESYNTRDKCYAYPTSENIQNPRKTGAENHFICLNTPKERKEYFRTGNPEKRKYWAKIYRRAMLIEQEIFFPQNLKYDDNYFKGMVFYHANRIYVLEEYLYHWMVNPDSISMQNDFNAHLDRMRVEILKLQEYEKRGLLTMYHDEMEYIFLEQFYANTFNTIATRNGSVPMEVLCFMRDEIQRRFPEYWKNLYIPLRLPVWSMGEWIENALRGIEQVRKKPVEVPKEVLQKIAPLSFLDLLSVELTQEELNWYCSIYVAFDKVANVIDYKKL